MFDRIDAALFHPIRKAVYFFRGNECVKYVPSLGVESLGGSKIRRIGVDEWRSLPDEFQSDIDAAFLHSDGFFYFFKGDKFVKYKPGAGVEEIADGVRIGTIGVDGWTTLPNGFRSDVDAAIFYPERGHAYFFKGGNYIKFHPSRGVVTHDGQSVRRLGVTGWGSLPEKFKEDIGAALYYPVNEQLYFFKAREYVRWDPGRGAAHGYPRRLGLRHRQHGGWPGLSTLLGGPFTGNVTTDSATIWMWLTGGKTTDDIIVKHNGVTITDPQYVSPAVGTAETDVLEGVEGVDAGSMVTLLRLSNLQSNSTHRLELCRADDETVIESIAFKTAPRSEGDAHIRIGLGSCSNSTVEPSIDTFTAMADKNLDLLILCGDNCYYYATCLKSTTADEGGSSPDWGSVSLMLARQLEARNQPQFVPIAQSMPVFSTWDDHDFSYNNCDGVGDAGDARWVRRDRSAAVYRLMWNHPYRNDGNHIYYDFHWGPLHFFMTDGRYHSKRNSWILGSDQCDWLLDGLRASDAPIKIIVVGSQMIYSTHGETFSEAAPRERRRILDTIFDEDLGPVLIFSGDVHFSECQRFPGGNSVPKIVEITSSPLRLGTGGTRPDSRPNMNRLWRTGADSFAVIEVDFKGKNENGLSGSITIEALDGSGSVLMNSANPYTFCRTVWDLSSGELN